MLISSSANCCLISQGLWKLVEGTPSVTKIMYFSSLGFFLEKTLFKVYDRALAMKVLPVRACMLEIASNFTGFGELSCCCSKLNTTCWKSENCTNAVSSCLSVHWSTKKRSFLRYWSNKPVWTIVFDESTTIATLISLTSRLQPPTRRFLHTIAKTTFLKFPNLQIQISKNHIND